MQYDIEVGESTPELDLRMEEESLRLGQYPGYALRLGQTDTEGRG